MSDFQTQLNKKSQSVKLTEVEQRELRERVVSFMEYHPRVEMVASKRAEAYIQAQPYKTFSFSLRSLQIFAGATAIFIFVVIPALAERAVPGDVLYPVKVSFNEEVRGTLTFSATEKIAWETERMERRISEVRLLATEGKLTDEVEAEAAVAVKAHADAAQEGISKLRATDADGAVLAEMTLGSMLEVQTAALNSAEAAASENSDTADLALVVKEAHDAVTASIADATPSYEKITAHLERETTRAYELATSIEGSLTDEERAEIERRLQDIDRKVALGNEQYATDGVVSEDLLEAVETAQKLISFMADINIRTLVALETLVPVEYTEDEKRTVIETTLTEIDATLVRVEIAATATSTDIAPEILEKVVAGSTQLAEMKVAIQTMTEAGSFDEALVVVDEATALRTDIETLLPPIDENAAPVETPVDEPVIEENQGSTTASTTETAVEETI